MVDLKDIFWAELILPAIDNTELQKRLESFDVFIDGIAKKTLKKGDYTLRDETSLSLGAIALEDLGLEKALFYEDVMSLLKRARFDLISSVLVPHIFLQAQPILERERLHVAMSPVVSSGGLPGNFYLGHNSLSGVLSFCKHPQGKEKEKRGRWEPASKFLVSIPI